MKKIFLSILMLSLMYNCDNNSVPSAEDNATFNKNVESWKDGVSGFSSEDPEKVLSIFADSLKWNNPEALMSQQIKRRFNRSRKFLYRYI